jgi:hypothetical protein
LVKLKSCTGGSCSIAYVIPHSCDCHANQSRSNIPCKQGLCQGRQCCLCNHQCDHNSAQSQCQPRNDLQMSKSWMSDGYEIKLVRIIFKMNIQW